MYAILHLTHVSRKKESCMCRFIIIMQNELIFIVCHATMEVQFWISQNRINGYLYTLIFADFSVADTTLGGSYYNLLKKQIKVVDRNFSNWRDSFKI